ncbi:MAG: IPExxxVDY family protein [Bacteroidales bacterium]|nr:IPExxxVDY family protein [Bacteroidales bacterium]
MGPKKHKLSVSMEQNYCLLGIVSDEPDYKLCWLMNNGIQTSFVKVDDLVVYNKKLDAGQSHSLFYFENENTMLTYRFIKNLADHGYFISNLRNIDYLLHIQGDIIHHEIEELIKALNALKSIRMCVPVDLHKISEKERLHLW